ncbi:MAG: DUF4339 domain-containing protein [Verrucomicrobia bacterium]|nr:DUF4339 domain-containing protein [Verrucomicrobiota bacterium]
MYKIIGADQREYGPITSEQMQQWIAEGRVNAQTLVWSETSANWKPLSSYPELAGGIPGYVPGTVTPAAAAYGFEGDRPAALDKVSGPSIGLYVTAGLGLFAAGAGLLINLFGVGIGAAGMGGSPETERFAQMMGGTLGIVGNILGIVVSIVIFLGANKMRKLESYGFSMAASIIAMIPCISPCCLVGLPIGIWAIVVLNKPEVKSQFK